MAQRRKLAFITVAYWFMLVYVVAALVWWFIALQQQNREMTRLRLALSEQAGVERQTAREEALDYQRRKQGQYVGEGVIFLLLILLGAVFVYRAVRRQLKLSQQQQNFMMAVTHELKTPIAVARLNMETLRKRQLPPEQQERIISMTLHETDRLNDLANNILLVARLEAPDYRLHSEPVDLSALAGDAVQQFRNRYPGREIRLEAESDIYVPGEPLLLRMLVNNLVENALKYAPGDKPVTVSLRESPTGTAELTVADEGPGIPDAEKPLVFGKFYRMGDESTRSAKGTGLGLYLCRRIARAHGGEIRLTDNQPQGALFTVRLPAGAASTDTDS